MFGKGKTPDELLRTARIRRRLSIAVTAVFLVGGLVLLGIYKPWQTGQDAATPSQPSAVSTDSAGQAALTASGTTVLASVTQILTFNPDDYDLQVESIQAAAGTTVAIGDPLLTLTSSSIEQARATLQREADSTLNGYNQAMIDYQESLAAMQATLAENRSLKSIAKQDYTIALFDLQQTANETKAAMDEAHDVVANHPARIAEAEKELAFYEQRLHNRKEDAEDSANDLQTANREQDKAAQDVESYQAILDFLDEQESDLASSQFEDVRNIADDRLKDAQSDLEQARQKVKALSEDASHDQAEVSNLESTVSQYESLVDSLTNELETANQNLAEIELAYNKADLALIAKSIDLELDYQTSLVDYQSADNQYEQSMQDAQAAYTRAERSLNLANGALEDFEAELGDGNIYARYAGPVTYLGYEAGDALDAATSVATLQNAAQVTVTVTIDQADISKLSVGDPVEVEIRSSGQTSYPASITSINPVSNSYSMSNVYYTVVVTLDDNASQLTDDLDATVTFSTAS